MSPCERTRRQYLGCVGAVAAVGLAGCHSDSTAPNRPLREQTTTEGTPIHPGYETATVRVETPGGDLRGSVTAAVADTPELRYTGLSDTESLPGDRGMLFVYGSVADRTYVMREMDFGLDIVFADADGAITAIHRAPAPGPDEDGSEQHYTGRGQYVLEVTIGWTAERAVTVGDRLVIDR